ncbi:MAG: HAMP domain-containing sensor histidine kinase [Bacteroidota bacterium]
MAPTSSFFRRQYLLFYASLLLFIPAALLRSCENNMPAPGHNGIAANIQAQLQSDLSPLPYIAREALDRIRKDPRHPFTAIEGIPNTLPLVVRQNGTLLCWSSTLPFPAENLPEGAFARKTMLMRNNKVLLARHTDTLNGKPAEVLVLLPLYRRYGILNDWLKPHWYYPALSGLILSDRHSPEPDFNISDAAGTFLFSVEFPAEYDRESTSDSNVRLIWLWLMGLGMLLFSAFVLTDVHRYFFRRRKILAGLAVLFSSLVALRMLMLWYGFPFRTVPYILFDPKFYGGDFLNPSLGDLLISVLMMAVMAGYIFRLVPDTGQFRRLPLLNAKRRAILGMCVTVFSHLVIFGLFRLLRTLFFSEQWTLDIAAGLHLNLFKAVSLLIFILLSFTCFFLTHTCILIFLKLSPEAKNQVFNAAAGTLVFSIITGIFGEFHPALLLCNLACCGLATAFRLPRRLREQKYQGYSYLFVCALACSFTGAYALRNYEASESMEARRRFAAQLITDNDAPAELLLNEMAQHIKADEFIRSRMLNPFDNKDAVWQKIRKAYIDAYFRRYDVQVSIFNSAGQNVSPEPGNPDYGSLLAAYNRPETKTKYPGIVFLNRSERNIFKRYLCFVPLADGRQSPGFIVIDLKLKKIIPGNVYPELLVDKRLVPPFQSRDFSYAIYDGRKLIYNFGSYNYERNFPAVLQSDEDLYSRGIVHSGFRHLALRESGGRLVVVSSETYSLKSLSANFSFLFLTLIFFVICFIAAYIFRKRLDDVHLTLATKIRIFLNAASLLPIITVCLLALSVMSSSYRNDLEADFVKRTEELSEHLAPAAEKYLMGELSMSLLQSTVSQVSRYSGLDVNLFSPTGLLICSSRPMIYERGLLSDLANPEAMARLTEQRQHSVLLAEAAGLLEYKSAYVVLRSAETGKQAGIMSIPFFESDTELNHQITDVVSSLLIIFTAIFIVFLALSYYASQQLVVPLKLITARLRRTATGKARPMEWNSKDEIGMLAEEYNRMLTKLEKSREALSRSEKESAWREMAQQVAHEIKNPLTPMKLTLQHLQKLVQRGSDLKAPVERSIATLLAQVDTLNDIATGFSTFAKMPVPRNEVVDLAEVLRNSANLHQNNQEIDLETAIGAEPAYVRGDARLLSRIFMNLILNAIQSVPPERRPHIKVELHRGNLTVKALVSDNGSGIPDELSGKIFMPNFSTKTAGAGIGLAVARRGITQLGGRIWFDTEPDKGTTFFVEMKLLEEKKNDEA